MYFTTIFLLYWFYSCVYVNIFYYYGADSAAGADSVAGAGSATGADSATSADSAAGADSATYAFFLLFF